MNFSSISPIVICFVCPPSKMQIFMLSSMGPHPLSLTAPNSRYQKSSLSKESYRFERSPHGGQVIVRVSVVVEKSLFQNSLAKQHCCTSIKAKPLALVGSLDERCWPQVLGMVHQKSGLRSKVVLFDMHRTHYQ